ncbi:putative pterin-4-alpha-carbinolamine dehydratase [Phycisphaerae bacterium RAS1]|nr:putative pterin-4-alpha-carbinolamine dehydratase [Phycisphaerae bacterium RAS1]
MSELAQRKCVPCQGGTPPLLPEASRTLQSQLGGGWQVQQNHHLEKTFAFPDFVSALKFVNRAGEVAEAEGHHPDVFLAWGKVGFKIWTHKIDGLTESDFVLAAKIERLAER